MSAPSPWQSALPSKLFFRIGEVASLVGVEPHVLRYWEREFRSIRPTKSAKGQRVYSRKDVENLLRVRDLLYRDGFTIAGAKKRLLRGADPATSGPLANGGLDGLQEREDANGANGHADGHVDGHADDADDRVDDDSDTASADEPESGPRSHGSGGVAHALAHAHAHVDPVVREKLTALRAEVEGFLHELDSERGEHV